MLTQTFEEELTRFKQTFYEAARCKDRAALGRMIHDGFILLGPEGQILDKAECLTGLIHPDSHFTGRAARTERKVSRSAGSTAVTEVADVVFEGTLQGQDRGGEYINTATYVRGPDGWQVISNTWQRGQSCPGCCGSMTVQSKCAVCGREGAGLPVVHQV